MSSSTTTAPSWPTPCIISERKESADRSFFRQNSSLSRPGKGSLFRFPAGRLIAAPTAGGSFFGQPPLTQPIPVVGEGLVPSRRKQASIPAKARQIRMRLRIRPAFLCDFRLPAGRPQGPPLRGWREIAGRRGRRPLRGRRRGLFPSQSTGGRTRRLTAPPVGGAKWANKETGRKPKGDLPIFSGVLISHPVCRKRGGRCNIQDQDKPSAPV